MLLCDYLTALDFAYFATKEQGIPAILDWVEDNRGEAGRARKLHSAEKIASLA